MTTWDERFRRGEYPTEPEPAAMLREWVGALPDGRALDVATGTGRNALFLAEQGYRVDALDQSREGLRIARDHATERGLDVDWIQADAREFPYPPATYDIVTISYFRTLDRLNDIKAALSPGGVLFYEHHLRSPDATVGPSTDRYRFRANELLYASLDLTVLAYEASSEQVDGGRSVTARVLARNSHGGNQQYPERPPRAGADR